jgi:hypothetical protein
MNDAEAASAKAAAAVEAAAEVAKERFKEKDYEAAATGFARAIELHEGAGLPPEASILHLLYCNRSAALASLGRHDEALSAARSSVAHGGDGFVKGHYRAALALVELQRWAEASAACRAGLAAAPGSAQLSGLLERCRAEAARCVEAKLLRAALPESSEPTEPAATSSGSSPAAAPGGSAVAG